MSKYEQLGKLTPSEIIKLVVSKLYDDLLALMYGKILRIINKEKHISLYQLNQIIENISSSVFEFPKDSRLFYELEKMVYDKKLFKTERIYDKNEDIFHGLYGDIVELPKAPEREKEKIMTITVKHFVEDDETFQETSVEETGAICQHNITWDKITAIRKKNPNDFTILLYEFILQYVVINYEEDFICKSCGTMINLKHLIPGGSYNEEGQYVSYYSQVETPLEDTPEYEKYKASIRNIEKMVERLASIGKHTFLNRKESNN